MTISHGGQSLTAETEETRTVKSQRVIRELSDGFTSSALCGSLQCSWEHIPLVFPRSTRSWYRSKSWHRRRLYFEEVFFIECVWLKTVARIHIVAPQQEHLQLGRQSRTMSRALESSSDHARLTHVVLEPAAMSSHSVFFC